VTDLTPETRADLRAKALALKAISGCGPDRERSFKALHLDLTEDIVLALLDALDAKDADQNTLAEFGRELEKLRSQAAEREALLRRGAELLEQDTKEIDLLRTELAAAKVSLWQYTRPTGYDVNGRTYGETFGFCSHKEMLFRDCARCDAGSGRPKPAIKEKAT
jgi:hypothetical protein